MPHICSALHTPQRFRLRISARLLSLLLLLLSVSGCSVSQRDQYPERQQTVLMVAGTYLTYVARGDEMRLNDYLLWKEFLQESKEGLSREEFGAQLRQIPTGWPAADHPLTRLDLVEMENDDDHAKVVLQRKDRPGFPEVTVQLIWANAGWQVIDDSIFGKGSDKLIAKVGQPFGG